MRARPGLVFPATALALALILSGCLGAQEEAEDPMVDLLRQARERQTQETETTNASDLPAPTDAQGGNASQAPAPAAEEPSGYVGPPRANLTIRGPDGVPLNETKGAAPLTVLLDIQGQVAGGKGYWTLRQRGTTELIDDGLQDPTTREVTFLAPGTHILRLYVTDGRTGHNSDVTVHVEAPPAPEMITITDMATGAWVPAAGYLPDINTHDFQLDVPVARIVVNLTGELTAADLDLELVAPDGRVAARHAGFNEPFGLIFDAQGPPIDISDTEFTYQMGEWILRVQPAAAVGGEYTVRVTFET